MFLRLRKIKEKKSYVSGPDHSSAFSKLGCFDNQEFAQNSCTIDSNMINAQNSE